MTIQEHYENFMSQPEIEEYTELYRSIIETGIGDWNKFYYGIMHELCKDRKLFVTPN